MTSDKNGLRSPSSAVPALPHVVFCHGNGEDSAFWTTTRWRFESNGYPRNLLHAFDAVYPVARSAVGTDDDSDLPRRSSTDHQLLEFSAFVDGLRILHPEANFALIGHSRGALTVRNYLAHHPQAPVSHLVSCAGANHGVVNWPGQLDANELNGAGRFIRRLNSLPVSAYPQVKFFALRSDGHDQFFWPDGRYIGLPGTPTGVDEHSPEIDGASTEVLVGASHSDCATSRAAFAAMFRFVSGRDPSTTEIREQSRVSVSGFLGDTDEGGFPVNEPPPGARLEVEIIDAEGSRLQKVPVTLGSRGGWGPVELEAGQRLRLTVSAPGRPTTHYFSGALPRSTDALHVRPWTSAASSTLGGACLAVLYRPGRAFHTDEAALLEGSAPDLASHGHFRASADPAEPLALTPVRQRLYATAIPPAVLVSTADEHFTMMLEAGSVCVALLTR